MRAKPSIHWVSYLRADTVEAMTRMTRLDREEAIEAIYGVESDDIGRAVHISFMYNVAEGVADALRADGYRVRVTGHSCIKVDRP